MQAVVSQHTYNEKNNILKWPFETESQANAF